MVSFFKKKGKNRKGGKEKRRKRNGAFVRFRSKSCLGSGLVQKWMSRSCFSWHTSLIPIQTALNLSAGSLRKKWLCLSWIRAAALLPARNTDLSQSEANCPESVPFSRKSRLAFLLSASSVKNQLWWVHRCFLTLSIPSSSLHQLTQPGLSRSCDPGSN